MSFMDRLNKLSHGRTTGKLRIGGVIGVTYEFEENGLAFNVQKQNAFDRSGMGYFSCKYA